MELLLPPQLEPYRSHLAQASKPYVKLSRYPDGAIDLTTSKLGGFPYLPYHLDYPTDADTVPLLFIAQINFAEVPPLENYPASGLLQFFLSSMSAQACTVRYLPEWEVKLDAAVGEADLRLLMEMNAPGRLRDNPITRPGRLQFERCTAPPDVTAFEFEQLVGGDCTWKYDTTLYRAYRKWMQPTHVHKLGGYGHFVQGDPRTQSWADPDFANYDLLLQLYSDEQDFGLRWGDVQEVCFFICLQDLQQQDFSRVRYDLCP